MARKKDMQVDHFRDLTKMAKGLQAKQNNIEESTNELVTIGKGWLYQARRSYYFDTEFTFEKLLTFQKK